MDTLLIFDIRGLFKILLLFSCVWWLFYYW